MHAFDPAMDHIRELTDAPPHILREIRRFFLDYKVLEEKEVVIDPFEGREKALQVIQKSLEDYLALPRSFFVH